MEQPVGIQIKRIKLLSFKMKEYLFKGDEAPASVVIDYRIEYNIEVNLVQFFLRILFKYESSEEALIEAEIHNVFEVENLKHYLDDNNNIQLPKSALVVIVSLSISHSRALIANLTAGTILNDLIMPIFDGEDVANHFFFKKENMETVDSNIE